MGHSVPKKALREGISEFPFTSNADAHPAPSAEDPDAFFFYENWESAAHLDAHLGTPHLVRFAGMLDDLLDERGLVITRLQRIA